jgi:lysophospholipase L1-like esterase
VTIFWMTIYYRHAIHYPYTQIIQIKQFVMANISKRKAFVFSVVLSMASILLFLLAIETFLTIRYKKEHALMESAYKGRDLCTKVSNYPELIYTRVPSKCDTNAHGYRDLDYSYSKEKGVFRIVIIGDSVAEGQGVDMRDTFAKVLERHLNRLTKGKEEKVEVIVLAQPGYSTSQELFLLEREAFRYSPDLIIWTYVLNDPANPVFHNSNGELGRYYFKPILHTANYVSRKIFEINERIKKANCPMEYNAFLHCVYWDHVISNIEKIADISEKSRIPIIFLIHPIFEEDGSFDNYSLASLHAKLGAAATAVGMPVVDVLGAYRSHSSQELTLPLEKGFDPLHPNEEGHRIVADYLGEYILDAGYFAFQSR